MEKMKTELLSPAGNFDCGVSAFTYGADAIYLGLKNFSARADAMNFSSEELEKITSLAHGLGKYVYVAINTVIQNHEIPELIEKLGVVENAKVDGIILQDFSLIPLIKKYFPKLKMHASTQMAVHNLEGAKILADIGFSRVVLARELSFQEIENITKNCGIETEVFIHGALCYSYSGLCFYSSFDRGESANRGKCTYPCRKIYGGTHPYAMKDLALHEYILKLRDIGVASLKIEGRKKTPLYVAATADYYRRILDGKSTKGCLDNIKRIFARPYTMLHFNGKNKDVIDRDFSGPRGLFLGKIERIKRNVITFKTASHIEKHDGIAIEINGIERPFGFAIDKMWVNEKPSFIAEKGEKVELTVPDDTPELEVGANIYCTSSQIAKSSYPFKETVLSKNVKKTSLDITFDMTDKEIKVFANGITVSRFGDFQKANNPEKMKDGTLTAFSKLGDSEFTLGNFTYNNDGYFAPISLLNDIRRELCEKLETKPTYVLPTVSFPSYTPQNHTTGYVLKIDNTDYISDFSERDFEKLSEIIIDIDSDFSKIQTPALISKVRVSIPVINRNTAMPRLKEKI
ncbi:MAG: U32 family peptidase, partial [bacterium]|nr:U32 family peptidase [bacterium]